MTLEEAIQNLTYMKEHLYSYFNRPQFQALELGIEALKRLKEHREDHIDITFRALPGETEEEINAH